jgi:hypothetical protein
LTLRLIYDKYGKHKETSSISQEAGRSKSQKQSPNITMTTSTTNRFLTNALRILCCASALTACSAWATVVTWQLSASGTVGVTKDLTQSVYTTAARGFDNPTVIDASHQFLFKPVTDSGAASASQPALSQSSKQPDESLLFAASTTQARRTTELDDAMATAGGFDEDFVSVPTVQFTSAAPAPTNASTAAGAVVNADPAPVPVPEMSALFPIVGLIAAVSCTQILRRRRVAQQNASRSVA